MQKLYELAETENIKVVEEYLPGKLKGFYYRKGKDKLICLEKRLNYVNKRIVFAEELGHHFTSYGNTFNLSRPDFITCNKNEYLARKWAAEFLIPDRIFKKTIGKDFWDLDLNDIAEDFGVTEELLEFRWNVWVNRNYSPSR